MAESSASPVNGGFEAPPPIEQILDKHKFDETIKCPAFRCARKHTQPLISRFHQLMYAKDKTRNVNFLLKLEDESGPYSIILLLPEAATHVFSDEDRELFKETGAELVSHDLFLGFDNRTLEWLLQHYLPHIDNIVSSFESIGHIAHMNLRGDDMLAAKYLIGAIVLEASREAGIRTVVNKVGFVDNEFRVLPMELIAGDSDTIAKVLESTCVFEFDFKDVFWNSRLQVEHTRITNMMKPQDVVCDMFAGVGPFAIPIARKEVQIYANDLNPESHKWMVANVARNVSKAKKKYIECLCMDGRDFARHLIQQRGVKVTHVLMNLPMLAPEFCDVFVKLFPKGYAPLPRVHVYCFGNGETPAISEAKALQRIESALGGYKLTAADHGLHIFKVRQTASYTLEYCISFVVPSGIAYMD